MKRAIAAALAAMLFAAGGAGAIADDGATVAAVKRCGTYKSTSIYDRARVVAIRGVRCRRARRIAIRYDHFGTTPGLWRCALAHDAGRRLFSCGKGGSGPLQDRPHALKAVGIP